MVSYNLMIYIIDYKLVIFKIYNLYLSLKRIARCILSNLELSTSSEVFCLKSKRNETTEKRSKTIGKNETVP